MQRIALIAVVGARALAKARIGTVGGFRVKLGNGRLEIAGVDAGCLRQFTKRCTAHQVTSLEMMAERHRERRHAAEPVFAQSVMITDQERGDLLAGLRCLHHRLHEVVIRIAFVGEAAAVPHHRDDAGFGAIDEMRHHALAAILAGRHRHRHPCGRVRQPILDAAARGFRQTQSIAGVASGARRIMLGAGRRVREHCLPPRHVMRETAAGKHHAARRVDSHVLAVMLHDRTAYRAVLDDQFAHRRRQPQRNVKIESRLGKPARQRIAVGQRHAPAVLHHVAEMLRQPFDYIERRRQRFRRAHEVDDLLAGAQHHAEHRQFRQRRAEILDGIAEFASVERARHHRAAALRTTRRFRVIVREGERHVELQRCLGREEINRLGAGRQKGIDARGVEVVAGLVAQISAGGVRSLLDAPGARQRGAGNPQPAAGAGRGAAEARFLFDDKDLEAAMRGGDSRRQAGGARSDHEQVAGVDVNRRRARSRHSRTHFFSNGHLDSDTGRNASSPFTVLTMSR